VVHPGLGSRLRLDRPLDFLVVADHSPVGRGAPVEGDRRTREFRTAAWSLYVDAGETHERVYDVAWAGDRRRDVNGRVPAIGSTVDVEALTYDNAMGSAELSTVWVDPDFNPDERAFYYVRVLEIPTLRHSTYDAVALGQDPAEATPRPSVIQERALSSPIWYTP
jgi:hypothetical protein